MAKYREGRKKIYKKKLKRLQATTYRCGHVLSRYNYLYIQK